MKNLIVLLIACAFLLGYSQRPKAQDLVPYHYGTCKAMMEIPHPQGREEVKCLILVSAVDLMKFWVMTLDAQDYPLGIYEIEYESGTQKTLWKKAI